MTAGYRPGWCSLCGLELGGAGVLCDQCWAGRSSREIPWHLREPLGARLQRLAHWERTGQPTRHVHRWSVAPRR